MLVAGAETVFDTRVPCTMHWYTRLATRYCGGAGWESLRADGRTRVPAVSAGRSEAVRRRSIFVF
jgi:hypothetical protein